MNDWRLFVWNIIFHIKEVQLQNRLVLFPRKLLKGTCRHVCLVNNKMLFNRNCFLILVYVIFLLHYLWTNSQKLFECKIWFIKIKEDSLTNISPSNFIIMFNHLYFKIIIKTNYTIIVPIPVFENTLTIIFNTNYILIQHELLFPQL